MKKVVIFGSTGVIGLNAVEAALKKGLEVRAFVRDPAKLPEHLKDKVEIVKGNVLEPDSVHEAVEGTDAVVITLGTRNDLAPTSDLSEGTKNIIDAMRAKNVKTVSACLSAFLFYEQEKVPPIFVNLNEDHKRMFQALKDSGLNWIAAFPPHFTDDPSREMIIEVNPEKTPGRTIAKCDLGTFLVDALSEPKYYKAVIGICNVPKE
ncbi:flavin reductase (NADPH) [Bombyx mandarina]|uniref:NAD(P)-binding domain-containing protein n=2 Tax=Bombyx TaxID=7090 RepID=A0A8R2R8H8_BOMMO|nr:flavin reductase (NADPH) [Bombyx mandarina]XP_037876243.1 flavin reductase (NADPH) [Bombyx mori]XP_037876244.1 flavin reductase (NADPH) [Bombyx mori]